MPQTLFSACTASLQVPNWSRIGRLKRSKFPNLGGGGHTFGGGAGAGMLAALSGQQLPARVIQGAAIWLRSIQPLN